MTTDTDFYVTLSSRASSIYFKNTQSNFTVQLPHQIDLSHGKWKVALTKLTYKQSWINIPDEGGWVYIFHANDNDKIDLTTFTSQDSALAIAAVYLCHKLKNTPSDPAKTKYTITGIQLNPGYYSNPGQVAEQIVRDFRHLRGPSALTTLPLYFNYDPNGKIIDIHGPAGFCFTRGLSFLKAMGVKVNGDVVIGGLDVEAKVYIGKIYGKNGKVPGVIDVMYAYSNVVDYNIVGDISGPFLTTIPIEGKNGETITYAPLRPEYKNVSCKTLQAIEFQLSTSISEVVPFTDGEVIATLHFKRLGIDL